MIAALASSISGLCLAGVIFLINQAIQTGMADAYTLTWQFLTLLAIYLATSILGAWLITLLSQLVVQNMRLTLSDKILKASFHKLEYQTKRLFTILTDDIKTVSNIVNKLPTILTDVATVVGCFAYMAMISWQLFGMFMIVFVVVLILYALPQHSYGERMRFARDHQSVLFGYFEGLIYGLKELTINKDFRDLYTNKIIKPVTEEQKNHQVVGKTIVEIFSRWGELMLLLGMGVILVVIKETGITNFEAMGQFLTVTLFTISPLLRITRTLPDITLLNIALEQIEKAGLDLEKEKVPTIESTSAQMFPVSPDKSLITLRDVTYSYFHADEEKFFKLGPINLEIQKGTITFIIGGNGSGKSTLAKVMCGLYPPESGEVFGYGKKVEPANVEYYRNQFNAIFSDFYLFEDVLHIPQAVIDERAEEYLKLLELDKRVRIENQKLTTTNLSTGQRKRLSLLLSYLEDKPIYLFDEWAAGLDPYYKRIFYHKLLPDLKARGKTVIAITHDETYFKSADTILMLKDGRLVESHLLHEQLAEFFS